LNDIAGYSEKYYSEAKLSHEEWEEKMKPKRYNPHDLYFKDTFPHILLVIENAHVLSRHYDKRTLDLLDTLIMRLHNHNGF